MNRQPGCWPAKKRFFRNMESETTDAHFERLSAGRLDAAETSTLRLDALRDLKNVNTHLVAAAAYPVLENGEELLRSRLCQEGEAQA
jgi:phosphate:Na+ symporter